MIMDIKDDILHGSLFGCCKGEKKNIDSGIFYAPYVPIQLSAEEMAKLKKRKRAGWTYATVSLEHPSALVRHKRGKVLETRVKDDGTKEFCLFIDKLNTCTKSGSYTLLGVSERAYEKEWVEEKYIKKFEKYDSNGNEVVDECN